MGGKHSKAVIFLGKDPSPGAVVTYGGVVDVVVGGDHAQVERGHVHLVLDADALGLLQVTESLLHQLRQVIRQVTV